MITAQTYVLVVAPAVVITISLAAVLWSRRAARRYDAPTRMASRRGPA